MSGALLYGAPRPVAEVKASDDGWEVAGYASTWDRDLGDDLVHPGAFRKSLEAGGARVRFLFAHDAAQVLGRPLELREDERGLFGRFRISRTRLGQDVHQLLVDGALDSFSIGFIPREFDRDEKSGVRHLKAVDLLECSLVALPMQPRAVVTAVKADDRQRGEGPAPPDQPAPVERVSLVETHRRRARLRELGRHYGVRMP